MNLLQEFSHLSNYEKIKVLKFSLIILAYGMQCVQFTGVPILFYRPQRIPNPDPEGPPSFNCEFPQIYSIPMEYDLYGDDEIWEVIILTSGYIAKYISYAFLILYPIKKSQTHNFFFAPILAIGISLSVLTIYSSPLMLAISFFFYFGSSSYFFGQVFSYTPTQFTGRIAENYVIILNTFWSIIMLFHIYFETFFGGWRENLIYFTGFIYLGTGIALVYIQKYIDQYDKNQSQVEIQQKQNQNNQIDSHSQSQLKDMSSSDKIHSVSKEDQQKSLSASEKCQTAEQKNGGAEEEETSFDMLKQIFNEVKRNKDVRNNIMIWAVCWSVCGVSYIGCVLALNRLKGNIFFNMFVSTLFEMAGNFLSIYFIKNFKIKKIIVNNLYVMGIAYVSFIFFNTGSLNNDNAEDTILDIVISIFPVIIAKATHETMWNLLLDFQKQIMDVKFHQFSFSFGNVFDIMVHSTLPYYQYNMEKIGFNQFIGYGFYSLIGAFCSQRFKLLPQYEDNENEITNAKEVIAETVANDVELQTITKHLIDKI